MQTLLISFSICFLGVVGAVILFSVAMRGEREEPGLRQPDQLPSGTGGFFLNDSRNRESHSDPLTDTLLLQLERHFRLEEQAASAFLQNPAIESLHAPSSSPLWD